MKFLRDLNYERTIKKNPLELTTKLQILTIFAVFSVFWDPVSGDLILSFVFVCYLLYFNTRIPKAKKNTYQLLMENWYNDMNSIMFLLLEFQKKQKYYFTFLHTSYFKCPFHTKSYVLRGGMKKSSSTTENWILWKFAKKKKRNFNKSYLVYNIYY